MLQRMWRHDWLLHSLLENVIICYLVYYMCGLVTYSKKDRRLRNPTP